MRLFKINAYFKFFFQRVIYLNTLLVHSLIGGEREGMAREMAREDASEEDMERRDLLWEYRKLTSAKARKLRRLRRELDEAYREWSAVSKLTEMLERGEITTEEARSLLNEGVEKRWEFLRSKGVVMGETA